MSDETIASLALITAAAVLSPLLADRLKRWVLLPTVVLELALGVIIGQDVLGWASEDAFVGGLASLGLAILMLLAGYEIDFAAIRGQPLTLAVKSWLVSLAIGFAVAGVFAVSQGDLRLHEVALGLALTTTALGTLLPILRDAGITKTPFGAYVLAAGATGEFLPIVGISLLLVSDEPNRTILLFALFLIISAIAVLVALRPEKARFTRMAGETLTTSAQFAVRFAMLLCVVMVLLAAELDLDTLLGSFLAGILLRLFMSELPHHQVEVVESKLEAVGFGVFVPLFFVVSGMRIDIGAFGTQPELLLLIPVLLVVFLFVRGLPVLALYTQALAHADRRGLALYSATALPLIVVITGVAVEDDLMSSGVAAALVAAGALSVLVFPLLAARVRGASRPAVVDEMA